MAALKRDPRKVARARKLRQQASDEEKLLWRHLRGRRLGGLKFRREHNITEYYVDFYCAEHSLAVEVDGISHDSREAQQYDERRDRKLKSEGVRVVRFKGNDVRNRLEGVLEMIYWEATGETLEW